MFIATLTPTGIIRGLEPPFAIKVGAYLGHTLGRPFHAYSSFIYLYLCYTCLHFAVPPVKLSCPLVSASTAWPHRTRIDNWSTTQMNLWIVSVCDSVLCTIHYQLFFPTPLTRPIGVQDHLTHMFCLFSLIYPYIPSE